MSFEKLTIDNELTSTEKNAISKIEKIDKDKIKTALKTEKITVKGSEKKLTFEDIADAFTTYDVKFSDNGIRTNDIIKTTDNRKLQQIYKSKIEATYTGNTPLRLKDLVNDPNENDFVYFMNKLSKVFTPNEQINETAKFTEETKLQLDSLKEAIRNNGPLSQTSMLDPNNGETISTTTTTSVETTKTNTTQTVSNETSPEKNINDTNTTTTKNSTETITPNDINIKLYGVTTQQIVDAVEKLKTTKPELADKITELLKGNNTTKEIQTLLGITGKDVDGQFGKKRHNRKKWVAKIEGNSRRELLYLLFFYIWQIKSVINV